MCLKNYCTANSETKPAGQVLVDEYSKPHGKYHAWYYGLDLSDNNNPSSLSAYLKLTKEQYKDVLEISGLAVV